MNGILEVEVTILHSGKKVSGSLRATPRHPEHAWTSPKRSPVLQPLKTHPRDIACPTVHRLERANRLWSDRRRSRSAMSLTLLIDTLRATRSHRKTKRAFVKQARNSIRS